MSSGLRALQSRHEAWRSFRDIAHATRSLAATRRARWAAHAERAGEHLAWVHALAELVREEEAPRPLVLCGIGSDLGFCGRLNHLVAAELERAFAELRPVRALAIGGRLHEALPPRLASACHLEHAPASPAAVLELAERLELELATISRGDTHLVVVAAARQEGGVAEVEREGALPASLQPQLERIQATLPAERRLLSDFRQEGAQVHSLRRHARLAFTFCRAQAVESALRWAVMNRAHEGAERRLAEQEVQLRRLRQEQITQEMLDVLGGRAKTP